MDFQTARPDVVRAINQRWLLNFWKRHLNGSMVPNWQAADSEDLRRIASNLSYLTASRDNGVTRFVITDHGATIGRVYGSADCRGKSLNDVIPPARLAHGLAPYQRAIANCCPVYTIHDVTDRSGRLVHFERLILPFTTDGTSADRIMASFEFICADGAYDSDELMSTQTKPPVERLSAIITVPASA